MKEWKCANSECGNGCIAKTPEDYEPKHCPVFDPKFVYKADWQPMGETLQDNSASIQDKRLPKLTAEVFDLPDCPEWAQWAAVDLDGTGAWFASKPSIAPCGMWWDRTAKYCLMGHFMEWDASDWQNSLIERPAKLPEWCKVGEWVAYYEDEGYKYFKIAKIELNRLYSEDGKFSLMCDVAIARLRPWTFEDAPISLKVKDKNGIKCLASMNGLGSHYLINIVDNGSGPVETFAEFAKNYTQLDNAPCGVLEHLEDGEWVE